MGVAPARQEQVVKGLPVKALLEERLPSNSLTAAEVAARGLLQQVAMEGQE